MIDPKTIRAEAERLAATIPALAPPPVRAAALVAALEAAIAFGLENAAIAEPLALLPPHGWDGAPLIRLMRTGLYMRQDLLDEAQAQRNHGQSVARLAERGGLSPAEALAIAERCQWRTVREPDALEALARVVKLCEAPAAAPDRLVSAGGESVTVLRHGEVTRVVDVTPPREALPRDPALARFDAWWSLQCLKGDPARRGNLSRDAYVSGHAQGRLDERASAMVPVTTPFRVPGLVGGQFLDPSAVGLMELPSVLIRFRDKACALDFYARLALDTTGGVRHA